MVKRIGYIWDELISFQNLLHAARESARRKRFRPAIAAFHFDLESELWDLHNDLVSGRYRPGQYTEFYVHEPKKRLISASPYRDRVVHHAITRVLSPRFEPAFIADSFACRLGKGTHAAVRRAQQFSRRFPYVLKADIRKFFPSVDHAILINQIERKVKDRRVIDLIRQIVEHSNPQEPVDWFFPGDDLFTSSERRRGLPIGNQTSQFFANIYLDPLDHFVKERLRVTGYVRYVDDFLIFSADKAELNRIRDQISQFLISLRLILHPDKSVIFPVTEGIRFLGYRVFPTHRLVVKENVRRFRRRVRKMQQHYADGKLDLTDIRRRIASWLGHARQADSHLLCRRLLAKISFQRVKVVKPCDSRRVDSP